MDTKSSMRNKNPTPPAKIQRRGKSSLASVGGGGTLGGTLGGVGGEGQSEQ